MINDYISIKEAVKLVNRSYSTIQRLCSSLEGTSNVKREGNKYLISKKYILEHFETTEKTEQKTENQNVSHDYSLIIQIMKDELEAKNQQISDLNERLREANIINLNYQKQLQSFEKQDVTKLETTTKTFWEHFRALFIIDNEK